MIRILICFVSLLLSSLSSYSQKKLVCFSIDDLPLVSYGISDTVVQREIMGKLIASLTKNKIPAIGFVNEIKLYPNNQLSLFQVGLLNKWVEHNLELGNHTYSHPDYNSLTLHEYSKDILKGEEITKQILKQKGRSLDYFRHPFLHTGNSKEKSDSLNVFLSSHGYTVAPVTIDNEDYLFALAYKRALDKNDRALMKQIGTDYVDYMEQKVLYFERQALQLFNRPIKQILLFHASALNADYVDALAQMFRKNNYEFITMKEALKDNAYNSPVIRYGNWGISWIDRWALSQGKKGDFFKGDPATPEYIRKLTE